LEHAPIEINHGTRDMLLRVPGIGPKLADAIIRQRRKGRIRSLSDLRKLGVSAKRAAPFILLAGKRPAHQLSFML
jgi:predicted DNA-binding helix-hairpin-helix protein